MGYNVYVCTMTRESTLNLRQSKYPYHTTDVNENFVKTFAYAFTTQLLKIIS